MSRKCTKCGEIHNKVDSFSPLSGFNVSQVKKNKSIVIDDKKGFSPLSGFNVSQAKFLQKIYNRQGITVSVPYRGLMSRKVKSELSESILISGSFSPLSGFNVSQGKEK